MIVTVDGPSGTGKSTVSRSVAEALGLPHLDTGAFYRAVTLAVLESGVDPDDASRVLDVTTRIDLGQSDGVMFLDDRDVSAEIRTDIVTRIVSAVSAHPAVRAVLVDQQRRWVEDHGGSAVVEGRDIGSVVFPNAELKIFLDARPEVRARRRAIELGGDHDAIADALEVRDRLDSSREASPLVVPRGALVVDTSEMTLGEVVDVVVDKASERS